MDDDIVHGHAYMIKDNANPKVESPAQNIRQDTETYPVFESENSCCTDENSYQSATRSLMCAVKLIDMNTYNHMNRVSVVADAIAREMFMEDRIPFVRVAGLLHDIGKICTPFSLLGKTDKVTDCEMEILKDHVMKGCQILDNIRFPWPVSDMVMQHHERLDGSGYPKGLKASEIKLEARILAVADTLDAISFQRPWRPGLGVKEALKELSKQAETGFDARVVSACIRAFRRRGSRIFDFFENYNE
ncbi:MAG: HD domain-containing protein [Candidatus Aegiribacteria sp.]|nr:HD domain-containing protein [Candidatus Aegiribacteria sp.]MBD3294801.1 HD domain-containing protein [Candidatus Fermentibacteria bacterium]